MDHVARVRDIFIACAGVMFILFAAAAIQFQEVIAPGVERLAERWS